MMLEELTTPTKAKLPMSEFADHLRLGSGFTNDGSEDAVLEVCLRSAMAAIEARIGKALITRIFSWQITRWFKTDNQVLPISPVVAITSLTLVDRAGTGLVIPADKYWLDKDIQRSKLVSSGYSLPSIAEGGHATIVFEAGFGAWASVPADLKHAMLLQAASFYENRSDEDRVNGMPHGVVALLERYRAIRVGGAG